MTLRQRLEKKAEKEGVTGEGKAAYFTGNVIDAFATHPTWADMLFKPSGNNNLPVIIDDPSDLAQKMHMAMDEVIAQAGTQASASTIERIVHAWLDDDIKKVRKAYAPRGGKPYQGR